MVRGSRQLRNAEEFDARVVTPTPQLAMELNPGSAMVRLAP